jgi:plasmid stability protein
MAGFMTLVIDIDQELESQLQKEAAQHGMEKEEYVRALLEERLLQANIQHPTQWSTKTKEEWIESFNAWMDSHNPSLPPLTDEDVSRESIYGDGS